MLNAGPFNTIIGHKPSTGQSLPNCQWPQSTAFWAVARVTQLRRSVPELTRSILVGENWPSCWEGGHLSPCPPCPVDSAGHRAIQRRKGEGLCQGWSQWKGLVFLYKSLRIKSKTTPTLRTQFLANLFTQPGCYILDQGLVLKLTSRTH